MPNSPILPSPIISPSAPAAPASASAQELIQNGSACWPGWYPQQLARRFNIFQIPKVCLFGGGGFWVDSISRKLLEVGNLNQVTIKKDMASQSHIQVPHPPKISGVREPTSGLFAAFIISACIKKKKRIEKKTEPPGNSIQCRRVASKVSKKAKKNWNLRVKLFMQMRPQAVWYMYPLDLWGFIPS